jgi:hypothetical protein
MTYFPKSPWKSAWTRFNQGEIRGWFNLKKRLLVISTVDMAEFRGVTRPQYQVSVSVVRWHPSEKPRRASDAERDLVLRDFDMLGAEEDNHEPGIARHFWRLCEASSDEAMGCECKETEELVVEPDGHRWSRVRGVP